MKDLVLHPQTRQALERVAKSGAHAVLITGELGAGKQTIAHTLASELLQEPAQNSPYFLSISSDGKSIGIEQIRELQKFLQLKTTGTATTRRVVIINDADTMTIEAQNALLKLLEESPPDTALILTAHKPHQLRPTIHSRVQTVAVLPPLRADVIDFFLGRGFKGVDIERSYVVSNGQMGLLYALLENATDHALANNITVAKQLYGMSAFERLTKVDELSKNREALPSLLFACKRICVTTLEQAALKQQKPTVHTWHRQLKLILDAENALKFTPNTKLLLTDLFIQM
jgi:replication-associated recombination protein RarA